MLFTVPWCWAWAPNMAALCSVQKSPRPAKPSSLTDVLLTHHRYDYEWERYDDECGVPFYELEDVGGINALSARGGIESVSDSADLDSGDFTDQFARYRVCRKRVWAVEHRSNSDHDI